MPLDVVLKLEDGGRLPSEAILGAQLGVSRATVRKVLAVLSENGVVIGSGRDRYVHPQQPSVRRFPQDETITTAAQVEKRFMEWMLRGDARPGTAINELELAREFGVATSSIREFLNRFQRFGLIKKRPNAGWVFNGITTEFGLELLEIREMFELRSAVAFAKLPKSSPRWDQLDAIRADHLKLLSEIEDRYHDFSDIDSRFHRLINSAEPNRFIDGSCDIITLIFSLSLPMEQTRRATTQ